MLTCDLCGGLGNQMFMIFNLIRCAKERGVDFWLQYKTSFPNATTRYPYWETMFSNLKPFIKHQEVNVPSLSEENIDQLSDSAMLCGYFQKPKYFVKYYVEIYDLLGMEEKRNSVLKKVGNVDCVSLHFRLGDYKKYQAYHPILTYDYYQKSVERIVKETNCTKFLYFYETEDEEYVKEVIGKLAEFQITFESSKKYQLDDWEEMLLMSLCKHHIIANSTFSWWGAYLNSRTDKKVIYPEKWFGFNEDMLERFPNEWIKM